MSRRRVLNGMRLTDARKTAEARKGVNAVAWFASQSFHQSAAEMPFEQIPMKELDKAGAALLPKDEPEPAPLKTCIYCGRPTDVDDDNYCSQICAIDAQR